MTGKRDYKVLLVGTPNVGKSTIFYNLTNKYANVSNYPGTTVDYSYGKISVGEHHELTLIDTPGLYNLITITEEENVAKKLIFESSADVIVHVIDAKNIDRLLPLTLQLIEAKLPVILVLNMIDEFKKNNMDLQVSHLEHDLGIPVVETIGINKYGIKNLRARIISVAEKRYKFPTLSLKYPKDVEINISKIKSLLQNEYPISKRALSLLLLEGDRYAKNLIKNEIHYAEIINILNNLQTANVRIIIEHTRFEYANKLLKEHLTVKEKKKNRINNFIDYITLNPFFGILLAILIIYIGLYKFVGQFGAGFLVDRIEGFYEDNINIYINNFFLNFIGDNQITKLFAGEYGIFTLAIRYAIAIVLPIVAIFFIFFSILEDSGYLVRLSMMLDGLFKKIGLSGRSVIPLVLGLGCGTMAVVVTRTLETIRERYIVTFLLALTIPCSAQIGVILAILGDSSLALSIWGLTILIILVISGSILNKYTKGELPTFFMEVPPIRIPHIKNILLKTYDRLKWYFLEVLPLFILASLLIWIGKIAHIFDFFTYILSYPAMLAGLPPKIGEVLLYGFFRRDFGIAGLYDIKDLLTLKQIVVSCVILTLFVPCIAQFLVTIKERGLKTAIFIFITVIPTAFLGGIIVNWVLSLII
ncbi:MAG: ferrous iron transport protein B [Deferribacterota bacterium]|nr:ferrous iron transport protein B [Deferribacterota bacterium]